MEHLNHKLYNMYELITCLTNAGDLIRPELTKHHLQVAYLASKIGAQLGLSKKIKKDLLLAGFLHDVGALSLSERLELIENEPLTSNNHGYIGAELIKGFQPLREVAEIIRYHHVAWDNGKGNMFNGCLVPKLSHIVHLADRIVVMIDPNQEILGQIQNIQNEILKSKNSIFVPELVEAFLIISNQEYIWLDLVYNSMLNQMTRIMISETMELDLDEVIQLAKIFANIIDFRSAFTANHSAGVAKTAEKLAELAGFSENECKKMLVAGYLHDLGKLAVENSLLEKPSKLDLSEFNVMKSHTFYTYRLLQSIKEFDEINQWASFHHERLDGNGYPFHLAAKDISLGSRIMAVADIFTAITEDRPYRKGMSHDNTVEVLKTMAENGAISSYIVSIVIDHFDLINEVRHKAQKEATIVHRRFLKMEEELKLS